jgi:ubiquitin-protein ligase E3 A
LTLFDLFYSDRSPIDGLSKLAFVVSRNGTEDDRLPSAHTCFNHLLLPAYSSIDVMRVKLRYAITQSEGFGLR